MKTEKGNEEYLLKTDIVLKLSSIIWQHEDETIQVY
jgi:hypothetical protein